jgi:hypothetical protein
MHIKVLSTFGFLATFQRELANRQLTSLDETNVLDASLFGVPNLHHHCYYQQLIIINNTGIQPPYISYYYLYLPLPHTQTSIDNNK